MSEDILELKLEWNKVILMRTLTFRVFRICSSPRLLKSSLDELKKLSQNGYPRGVVNYNMNDALQNFDPNHHSSQNENFLSFTFFRATKQNR